MKRDSALSTLCTSESLVGADGQPQLRINDSNSEGSGQATLSNKIQFMTGVSLTIIMVGWYYKLTMDEHSG